MERTISVEEKIRRAEEIYQRRKQGEIRPITKVNVSDNKKDVRLLKKMIIQILVCVSIYLIVYTVQNSNYVFSEDFTNKINEILSYDTNFYEIYQVLEKQFKGFFINEENSPKENNSKEEKTEEKNNEGIGGAEINKNIEVAKATLGKNDGNLTSEEQILKNIKGTTTFIKPIEGAITSRFGQRETATGNVPKNHTGTDIAAITGTKIKSATDGEVVLSSEEGDYGKHLKIQIGEVSIIYAHCNNLYVKQGDKIKQGQEIAEVGSTGNSTGPHLHFEVRYQEKVVDPQTILEL